MQRVIEYIEGVHRGDIAACKWVRLAVARQIKDLERAENDPENFPYYFDIDEALEVLRIFESFEYTKGKWRGGKARLMPWQAFVTTTILAWKETGTGKRRFRDAYIKVPRKNAKTELLIWFGMFGFAYDREKDPEIYWFATKKDQAKVGWQRQKLLTDTLRKKRPELRKYCDTTTYRIFTNEGLGFVVYLGKDSKSEDGPSPYYGICDEYHAHPSDKMVGVIESGMGARESPLMLRITTAGTNPDSPCKRHEEYCENILMGRVNIESVFCIMYGIDKDDDLDDPAVWRKANPSYDYIDTLPDYLHKTWEKAKSKGGTDWVNFLTKNLNVWSDVIEDWIELEKYLRHATDYGIEELKGRKCFGGLDLASVRDTNALCLFFPAENSKERHRALWYYWLPEKEARERAEKHNVDYLKWSKDGYIKLTPGNAVDYAQIAADITGVTLRQDETGAIQEVTTTECPMLWFEIDHINYDRRFSPDAIPRLTDQGIKMQPIGQGYLSLSAPTKKLESMILNEEFDPGRNLNSEWQFSNIVIEQDSAENIKITKNPKYQHRKVDGMQALVMAIAGWLDHLAGEKDTESVYSTRGIRIIE